MKKMRKVLAALLAGVMAVSSLPLTASALSDSEFEHYDVLYIGAKSARKKPSDPYNDNKAVKQDSFRLGSITTVGGKLMAAVTPYNIRTPEQFAGLFSGAKINKTSLSTAAKAKIKDGVVTVSAGKMPTDETQAEGGWAEVNVWIYEVIDKKLVWSGDGGIGEVCGVDPVRISYSITALITSPVIVLDESELVYGKAPAGAKSPKEVNVAWYPAGGSSEQPGTDIYVGDKKNYNGGESGWTVTGNGINTAASSEESWGNYLCIVPTAAVSADSKKGNAVTFENTASKKKVKVSFRTVDVCKVTLVDIGDDITFSFKDVNGIDVCCSSKRRNFFYVPDGGTVTVTGGSVDIKVGESNEKTRIEDGGTFKVDGADIRVV